MAFSTQPEGNRSTGFALLPILLFAEQYATEHDEKEPGFEARMVEAFRATLKPGQEDQARFLERLVANNGAQLNKLYESLNEEAHEWPAEGDIANDNG